MNFKSIGLNAAIATTLVAGSALAVTPAQAAMIGSVSVSGQSAFSTAGSTTTVNFLNQKVSLAFGDFSSLLGNAVTVNPLTLVSGSTPTVEPFIDFGTFTKDSTTANLSFVLNPSTFNTFGVGTFGLISGGLDGFFKFGGETVAKGNIFASSFGDPSFSGSLISINTTAVPTPALLPGLLALGAGVLRKRKAEATEEVQTDA
jgi:hypothetical protein